MKKKFIKLNNNDNNLSLGNLCRYIKEISINKVFASQTEVFCAIFDVEDAIDSTVNNYCIGYRSIGSDYKDIYYNFKKKYYKDEFVMVNVVLSIVSILDANIYSLEDDKEKLNLINNNERLKKLVNSLYNLAKNDTSIKNDFTINIKNKINDSLYEAFCEILFYIVLEKKQPIYIDNLVKDAIENILNKTNISMNDLEKFLNIQFMDGINYIYSIKQMTKDGNPYAAFELGMMEYNGAMVGYPRYNKCYEYLKIAASSNHPRANFMIAWLIYNKKIGNLEKEDLEMAWHHINIAKECGSIAAINSIGLAYLNGFVPNEGKNINKAIEYFTEASNYNYAYAFNNLGKIYENNLDYEKAFNYYLKSALLEESWACNKIGEFYRLGIGCKKNLKEAFKFYSISNEAPVGISELWSKYNLAKYFYLDGCYDAGVEKDENIAISLLEDIADKKMNACILLIYIYSNLYLKNKNILYSNKIKYYANLVTNFCEYNDDIKTEVEYKLKCLADNSIDINIIIKQGN